MNNTRTVKVKRVFVWEYEVDGESYKEWDDESTGDARLMDDEEIVALEMTMGTSELMELFAMHVENENSFEEFCNVTIETRSDVGDDVGEGLVA